MSPCAARSRKRFGPDPVQIGIDRNETVVRHGLQGLAEAKQEALDGQLRRVIGEVALQPVSSDQLGGASRDGQRGFQGASCVA